MHEMNDPAQRAAPTLTDEMAGVDTARPSQEAPPAGEPVRGVVPELGRPPADARSFVGPESTPSRGVRKPPIPSVAAIGGHPLHPMVVPLPIGALSLALASDVAYAMTHDRFFNRASELLLGAGIVTGVFSAALGATDFLGRSQIRDIRASWLHAGGNLGAVWMSVASLALRRRTGNEKVLPFGLALSLATGSLLLLTGWLGGELSYRYRVGVVPD